MGDELMIFQHTLTQVLQGRKTQTRRLLRANEEAVRGQHNRIEAVLHNGRTKWRVGQTYAVQPSRNAAQVARIKITHIDSELITDISTEDAIAEGYDTRAEFLAIWETIHGANRFDTLVWVLTFELASDN